MCLLLLACTAAPSDTGAKDSDPAQFRDADGDGFGDPSLPDPAGVDNALDCDDGDSAVFPGADEHCDAKDEDCDGVVDEDPIDPSTWYVDADDDGSGDGAVPVQGCEIPDGAVVDGMDCDDTTAAVHPGASESCGDGIDQDCDGADLACHEVVEHVVDAETPRWIGGAPGALFGSSVALGPQRAGPADIHVGSTDDSAEAVTSQGAVTVIRGARIGGATALDATDGCALVGFDGVNSVPGSIAVFDDLAGSGSVTSLVQLTGEGWWVDGYSAELCEVGDLGSFDFQLSPPEMSGNMGISSVRVRDEVGAPILATGAVGAYQAPDGWWDGTGAVFLYDLSSGEAEPVGTILAARWMEEQYFGASLSAGDMDGDGIDDLAVGAPASNFYENRFEWSSGRAYVFAGPFDGDRTAIDDYGRVQDAALMLYRDGIGLTDSIGYSVSIGDVDGDGYGDLLAGAPELWNGYGRAYLLYGPPNGERSTDTADAWFGPEPQDVPSQFGVHLTLDSDLDGDGNADVALPTPMLNADGTFTATWDYTGGLWLYYGRRFSGGIDLADVDERWQGMAGTGFGESIAGGADIDGDGFDDLVVGAPLSDGGLGAVFPIYGG